MPGSNESKVTQSSESVNIHSDTNIPQSQKSGNNVTREEILHGRDSEAPLTPQMEYNLGVLLERLNKFRDIYGKPMLISSGYRTPEINRRVGGAQNSPHLTCEAADISDADGSLKKYIASNLNILDACDLYQEDPSRTTTWVHLQTRKVSRRVFLP